MNYYKRHPLHAILVIDSGEPYTYRFPFILDSTTRDSYLRMRHSAPHMQVMQPSPR